MSARACAPFKVQGLKFKVPHPTAPGLLGIPHAAKNYDEHIFAAVEIGGFSSVSDDPNVEL
jgi:hypothetical protein